MSSMYANIQGLSSYKTYKIPFIKVLQTKLNALFPAFTETHIKDYMDSLQPIQVRHDR